MATKKTHRTSKPKTKTAAFLARIEKLTDEEGPELERIRLAIREGLLVPGLDGGRVSRGGCIEGVIHNVNLARIHAHPEGVRDATLGIEDSREPESPLTSLAFAAEKLDRIIDAVTAELDRAEADNAARRRARRVA